jgi:hypothetical protein
LAAALLLVAAVAVPSPAYAITCPLGLGFWTSHSAVWPASATTQVIGGTRYAEPELLAILNTPSGGDGSLILAKQLIAANLNLANGAFFGSVTDQVIAVSADANTLLAENYAGTLPYLVHASTANGQQLVNDAGFLESYNSGTLTPSCPG